MDIALRISSDLVIQPMLSSVGVAESSESIVLNQFTADEYTGRWLRNARSFEIGLKKRDLLLQRGLAVVVRQLVKAP